jgi:hypothetical protein
MRSFLILLFVLVGSSSFSQCPNPERFIKNKGREYSNNSQSRSAYIRVGEVFETVFICQGGYDYRFTIEAYEKDAGNIKYEVYEMVVSKVEENGKYVYKKQKHVLYSSVDNQPIEIRTDDTRKIYIKMLLDGEDIDRIECVGILAEYKKAKKVGF